MAMRGKWQMASGKGEQRVSSGKLEEFKAYRLALDLFDLVVAEIDRMFSSTIESLKERMNRAEYSPRHLPFATRHMGDNS